MGDCQTKCKPSVHMCISIYMYSYIYIYTVTYRVANGCNLWALDLHESDRCNDDLCNLWVIHLDQLPQLSGCSIGGCVYAIRFFHDSSHQVF